ncbi:MAG: UDP binding domain-containing protein, partial [Acidimicrobiia bacterium]
CENNPPIARMNFVNAELTKLSVNTYVTTKITFANMIARICEKLPEADSAVVTETLGLDSRIGRKYLKGGMAYGGPCFPRDNQALAALARQIGTLASLAETTDSSNREQISYLADLIKAKLPSDGIVGVLGLSYKPNTDVIDESAGLLLAELLSSDGASVVVFDPQAMTNAKNRIGGRVVFASSLEECVEKSDVVVITTAWDLFRGLDPELVRRPGARRTVIDCWGILDDEAMKEAADYLLLGTGPPVGSEGGS